MRPWRPRAPDELPPFAPRLSATRNEKGRFRRRKQMKRVGALLLIALLMLPGMAWAGSSTDAALGLGAFAALGTILLGAAVLSHPAIVAPAPVVVPPPAPPVVYAPP